MKYKLSESKQNDLRRWAYENTWKVLESKIEKLRQDAKDADYGTKHRARLFAASNFLRYDKTIRQMLECEPEDIWVGEDWA